MKGLAMSNRQYPMLEAFAIANGDFYMPLDDARKFDQRPFRSMLVRKWISYRAGKGFYITRDGRDAWIHFHQTDITRRDPMQPLTAYFDVAAYGLKKPASAKRGAA